jgi:hypothetical protein
MEHTYYILDLFAEKRLTGNQLSGVCDAGDIPDDLQS